MANRYSIGQQIRYWRLIRKLSQAELAEKVGMNQSQISKIEQGVRRVLAHEMSVFAEALGISVNDLIERTA